MASLFSGKKVFLLLFLYPLIHAVGFGQIKIIYETDMDTDCDDAGALAMLHAFQDNGEVDLLAVMHNTSDNFSVGYIDAVNTYYGHPDLPIGAYKKDDSHSRDIAVLLNCCTDYARQIVNDSRFKHDVNTRDDVPEAVTLYKEVLQEQPDSSVVIISVGYLLNLKNLIADDEGLQLVRKKVKDLIIIGRSWFPKDTKLPLSMNLGGQQINHTAAMASMKVFGDWPTPIHVAGNLMPKPYHRGKELIGLPENNPVREAYRIYRERYGDWDHHLADLETVFYAVYRDKIPEYFSWGTNGTPKIGLHSEPNGIRYFYNLWDTSEDSPHVYWLTREDKFAEISQRIGELLIQPPK